MFVNTQSHEGNTVMMCQHLRSPHTFSLYMQLVLLRIGCLHLAAKLQIIYGFERCRIVFLSCLYYWILILVQFT